MYISRRRRVTRLHLEAAQLGHGLLIMRWREEGLKGQELQDTGTERRCFECEGVAQLRN